MVQVDAERQQRLVYLRSKVADLRNTERQLSSQLSEVRQSLKIVLSEEAEISNLSAPVACLPNEILGDIFRCLKGSCGVHGIPCVVVVSHVTRHWRHVALSNPSLWDTIYMNTAHTSLDLPITFLTRSKPCKLDVMLTVPEDAVMSGLHMIPILFPHICHIRRLTIQSNENEHIVQQLIESLIDFQVPSLEHLEIDMRLENNQDAFLWRDPKCIFTGCAPLLSSIVLNGIGLQCCTPPLGGITRLLLDSDGDGALLMTYDYFCNTISACRCLTWLELRGRLHAFGQDESARRIEIPSLVYFAIGYPIHYRRDIYIRRTIETISAPGLRTLSLNAMYRQTLQMVFNFIQSHMLYPMLQHLRLEEATCITTDFIRATPSITHLTLMHLAPIPRKMAPLRHLLDYEHQSVSQTDILWPRLQSLTVCVFEEALIRDLITTRTAVGAPLVTLRIESDSYDALEPHHLEWCRERVNVQSVNFEDL
jgi:hypothetical protein